MRIAICDDDQIFLEKMKNYLEQYQQDTRTPIEFSMFRDGDKFLEATHFHTYDICFLDIMMPLLNGMDTAKELRKHNTSIKLIFLTSSAEYAVESYEVKASDYLLKPLDYDRFCRTMDDLTHALSSEEKSLLVKSPVGYQKVYIKDIEYLESLNKIVMIHLKNGTSIETKEPLYCYEEKLAQEYFFKCHRSYLVNLNHITTFNSTNIKMNSGRSVPIARGYSEALKDTYFRVMFKE